MKKAQHLKKQKKKSPGDGGRRERGVAQLRSVVPTARVTKSRSPSGDRSTSHSSRVLPCIGYNTILMFPPLGSNLLPLSNFEGTGGGDEPSRHEATGFRSRPSSQDLGNSVTRNGLGHICQKRKKAPRPPSEIPGVPQNLPKEVTERRYLHKACIVTLARGV